MLTFARSKEQIADAPGSAERWWIKGSHGEYGIKLGLPQEADPRSFQALFEQPTAPSLARVGDRRWSKIN